ncbi:hypothetical protein JXB12_09590 [candidate division KSB1 bacterium]|nr:hypothetical protein [candidate division KSB1 bacterium]
MNRTFRNALAIGIFLCTFVFINESFAGEFSPFTVVPNNPKAGEQSLYSFQFTTSDTGNNSDVGIPIDGKIVLTFPNGFDLSGDKIATLSVSGGFADIFIDDNVMTLVRDTTGTAVTGGQSVTLAIYSLVNHQTATNYTVMLETRTVDDVTIDSGTSSPFAITHGSLDHFTWDPIGNQTASTPFSVVIKAKDQYENTVLSFSQPVNLSDKSGTLTPVTTTNFSSGVWYGNLTITQTYINNALTAIYGSKLGISNTFNVNAGPVHHFRFAAIGSPQTAGIQFSVIIYAEDQNNNRVKDFTETVNISDNTGTISPAVTGSFSSGQWSGGVTITKKQNDVEIYANRNDASGVSNRFNVVSSSLSYFLISPINNQTAGVPFITTITARDVFNNLVDQFTGTVAIQDLSGSISPTVSSNFYGGQWTGSVKIDKAYTNDIITVTRSSGGSENGTSNGFNVSAGSLDHFELSSVPSPQTAGVPFGITITAKDANNNTIASFAETANLSDLTNTLSPAVTGNFTNGIWTGNVSITEIKTGNRITATSSGKSGSSNLFNVNAAALHHFTFETINSPQTAGQSFSITITAEDSYNNRVTQFNQTVNLSDNSGTIQPIISGNFSSGQWSGLVTITRSQTDIQIDADRSGITGQSNHFNVIASTLDNFLISPVSTQAAGELFGITVMAQDEFANRVNYSGTVTISDLSGTITPTTSGNFNVGQWTGNVKISSTYTNNQITVIESGGGKSGTSNLFDVVAGDVDHFTINAIPNPQVAGNSFTITITAQDENNSTVDGFTGNVNLSDLTGTITPKTSGNFVNGVWTGDITITKSYINNRVTVYGSGRSGESNLFNVVANSVHHFTFGTIESPKTAGQNFNITITAKDQFENTVTSFTNVLTLSDATGTITPTTTGNLTGGQITQSVVITKSANDVSITASDGSKTGSSNGFNLVAASLDHFNIASIGTQAAGAQFPISVTARDMYNNIRTQFSGTVDISDQTGSINPVTSGSFTSGQWTGNVSISKTMTNNYVTVKRTGGSESGNSNLFNVISSNIDHFLFDTIASPQIAGDLFTITVTAKDAQNNTVTTFNGAANLNDLTGTIDPAVTGNFTNGVWSDDVAITTARTNNVITITYSGKSSSSNPFNVQHAALDHFRFAPVNSPQTAGNPFNVQIYAEDMYSNRVQSFTTYVELSDITGTISPVVSGNFVNGSWNGSVNITRSATDVTITAQRLGVSGTTNNFNIIASSLAHFTLGPISTQAAGEPFSISVQAEDAYGNVRTQFTQTVDISDLTGSISPTRSENFIQGFWSGPVIIRDAREDNQITVMETGGTRTGNSNSFDVISSTVDHFEFNVITSPQEAGTPFNITITAKDAQNNTVTDFNGVGELADKTGTISPNETGSFSSGIWSGSVTITKAQSDNWITITSSGKASSSNTFDILHNDLHHFRFENVGSPQTAGTLFTITVYAEDQFNNRVTTFNSSVSLSDLTASISPATSGNFVNGSWSNGVQITRTRNDVTITAQYSGISGVSNKFNVVAGALHHFAIESISTQAAGEPFTISVRAEDEYANIRTQFTGTVDISDLTGSISPMRSGNFLQGLWSGPVTINEAFAENKITIQRTGGSEVGISNSFDVISSSVDHFEISQISSPKEAGVAFTITITAKDALNNTVVDFNGTGVLSDKTGTITPSETGTFNSGVWSGTVSMTKAYTNNVITITSSGKASSSNQFNIIHAELDHFKFSSIGSPQIAGSPFLITIKAEDVYNNTVISFNSFVTLSEATGTLVPNITSNFTNGTWSDEVTITKSQSDLKLQASSSGKSGNSNLFNVVAGSLANFSIAPISTQAAGEPFPLTATALDAYGNVVNSFSGTVDILDLTGTIEPTLSDNFIEGRWTGNVTISQVKTNNRITVKRTGSTESGQSNEFNVISSDINRFLISTITSPKIAGDNFPITITALDKDGNIVTDFQGTASLSDLSGSITPGTTENFSNGVWTGDVRITEAFALNAITATSSGKVGTSNSFDVIHASLHHFVINSVLSPQVAGTGFTVTITARDVFENDVKNFTNKVTITDNTGTVSPPQSTNFSQGKWSGSLTITKAQNDVQITVGYSGKIGVSNSFNVIAGPLDQFVINNLTTQAAGEPFQLVIRAIDAFQNVVTTFINKVTISDLTGTIKPTTSDNFNSGIWVGNVTISTTRNDNRINVVEMGGTKTGESNLFDVISSDVDHFRISPISSPQIAGKPFEITIVAEDADSNIATAFNDKATISDYTATLLPTTTASFINGSWTGSVVITKAKNSNRITTTALGKAGVSNEFSVSHGDLDHFYFEVIPSPQIAGEPFLVKITAQDSMNNTVTGFNQSASLSDVTQTITPSSTTNFANGIWEGEVTITTSQADVMISVDYGEITGYTNKFYVKPAKVNKIMITDAAGGNGLQINDRTVNLDEKIRLYASGFDSYGNYVRDIISNWSVLGDLDLPAPSIGRSTTFDPKTPGTSGRITADSLSLIPDSTGIITVGSISYVKILTASGGLGRELGDTTLTADQQLTLYSAGFDAGANYIGDVVVEWRSAGSLDPAVLDSSAWIRYNPKKAPATGRIYTIHPTAIDDTTGIITVKPGEPVGEIGLTADPDVLIADGVSQSAIRSTVMMDADSNVIAKNTLFTVHTDIGQITDEDKSSLYPGIQVAADDFGKISFVYRAPVAGGIAHISVSSLTGSATGFINILISSIEIVSINSIKTLVSQGQNDIPVTMTVKNLGTSSINQLNPGLTFIGPPPDVDRNDEFKYDRTDNVLEIPGGGTRILNFNVDVSMAAKLDTIKIDGYLSGQIEGIEVSIDSAKTLHSLLVQKPAQINIGRITSVVDTVSQGQENILVSMKVRNLGQAAANVVQDTLIMRAQPALNDISSEFIVISQPNNPKVIQGESSGTFNFFVSVLPQATLGNIMVDGRFYASDTNSNNAVSDSSAEDSTLTWFVKERPLVGIQSFVPSQNIVSQNQEIPWYITMRVANNGGTAVKLDSVRTIFLSGGRVINEEFDIIYDDVFIGRGNDRLLGYSEDSLRIIIDKTGSSLGPVTITGYIYLTDISTNKQIEDQTNTGITVVEPANLSIVKVVTSQDSITRNQGQDWYVHVVLENKGGTDILLDLDTTKTFITFTTGTDFQIKPPVALNSGGLVLSPDEADTLTFIVDGTGWNTGTSLISVRVTGKDVTTGSAIVSNAINAAQIIIEKPAAIRIVSMDVLDTPNGTIVNTNQQFKLQVLVENLGDDDVEEFYLGLESDGGTLDSLHIERINRRIKGKGGQITKSFILRADDQPRLSERFTVHIDSAVCSNTLEAAGVVINASLDSSETITIQRPGDLKILNIILPAQKIYASQIGEWEIKVALIDQGQADVELDFDSMVKPVIRIGGEIQNDYSILSSDSLQGGGKLLRSGIADTVIYRVVSTGEMSGTATVSATAVGFDVNDQRQLMADLAENIQINTSATVRLAATSVICNNYYDVNRGLINRGQQFDIHVMVENQGRVRVDSVVVELTSTGLSVIDSEVKLIPSIELSNSDSVSFTITADTTLHLNDILERFTANVNYAKDSNSGELVTIDNSGNNFTIIRIQEPAKLSVSAMTAMNSKIYTTNQIFILNAVVNNVGSAAVAPDSALLSLLLPDDYYLVSEDDIIQQLYETKYTVGDTLDWPILTPAYPSEDDTIIVFVNSAPKDLNIDLPAQIFKQSDTLVVQTSATNLIVNSEISNPVGARDGILSTEQKFIIKSVVQYSQNLHDVTAELVLPDNYNLQDQSKKIQDVVSSTPVNWDILAPVQRDNRTNQAVVRISYYEVGNPVQISMQDTVYFSSVNKARLVLNTTIDNANEKRLTIGQLFKIKSVVENLGEAAVTGKAQLSIDFGDTRCDLDPADTLSTYTQDFKQNQPIEWSVVAPMMPIRRGPIIVTISSVPTDENSGVTATTPFGVTDTVYVETEEGGAITNALAIESPEGAVDKILSTYQQFTVRGQITTFGVDNIKSTIILPTGFSLISSEQAEKDILNGGGTKTVRWGVIAPKDSSASSVIKLYTRANDINSNELVVSDTTYLSVSVVERAEASVVAGIISPYQATDGVVSTGQAFRVEVKLENSGTAKILGEYGIKITLPSGYTIADSDRKTGPVSSPIYWDIFGPAFQSPLSNIVVGIVSGAEPYDENTNEASYFIAGTQTRSIPVMTIQRSVNISTYADNAKIVAAQGEKNVFLLGLEFVNSEENQISNEMLFKGMRLSLRKRDGKLIEDPTKAISRISVVAHANPSMIFGEMTEFVPGGIIDLNFSETDTIHPATKDSVDILVDISAKASVENFMVQIDSARSLSIEEAYTTTIPNIIDEFNNSGSNFSIKSDFITLMSDNLKESFGNYPNPFGNSSRPNTHFTYYLKQNTNVRVKIYTLLGELVWSASYKAIDLQGQAGSHDGDITWDGRNDNGDIVLNGVYIAYISTDYGDHATTKIAVLK